MEPRAMELALGTVQFGLAYGAVGSGHAVDESEAQRILDAAWSQGLRTLDTAAAYGDIEARLGALCGSHQFRIISKIRPLGNLAPELRLSALRDSIEQSQQRLGSRLGALMFHSAPDLLAEEGPALWALAEEMLRDSAVKLGVSCYAPQELLTLRQRCDIRISQLPTNAFDQRLLQTLQGPEGADLQTVELHVRSAFLQGLLLAPALGAQRVPAASASLQRWQQRCESESRAPAVAALGVVKALPGVHACVVGVESLQQWQEVQQAWQDARPLHWPDMAATQPEAFDPRLWPRT